MSKKNNINLELLEIMHAQEEIIENQSRIISKLANETIEQKAILDELMGNFVSD